MSLSSPSTFLCVAGSCTVVDKKCSHHRCETMRPVLIQKNLKNGRMRKESIKQTNYSLSFTDVTFLLMPLQGFFVSESATTGSHEGVCHFGPTFSPLHMRAVPVKQRDKRLREREKERAGIVVESGDGGMREGQSH